MVVRYDSLLGIVVIGILFALLGGIIWYHQENLIGLFKTNRWIILGIVLILIGGVQIIFGMERILHLFRNNISNGDSMIINHQTWWQWIYIVGLIFVGSVSYTIAAYYHLKLENWTFLKAFALAVPLILIEYQFSIRGNFAAKHILRLNAVQITLITMSFYFINAWILNYFFLRNTVIWWRELLAFAFIISAFLLTTNNTT
jgi:hypothetical protein